MQTKLKDYVSLADIVTLFNAIAGLFSIFFVLKNEFTIAAALMIASLLCDWLDGKVARLTNRKNRDFGIQMDSLADVIGFGVAPAVFGLALVEQKVIGLIIISFFLGCGILRLARFNVTTKEIKGFLGMPITVNGLIFPVFYFISPSYFAKYGIIAYFASSILMASSFKLRKVA